VRFIIVLPPKNLGIPAYEAITLSNSFTHLMRYPRDGTDLARALDNLGVRFSELGRPADALPATQEAVTTYRELAAANPDRYRPDLARALNNLGILFSELGRSPEAEAARSEALAIRTSASSESAR
jgi:tetratricopeptide (TPR) repeat protein